MQRSRGRMPTLWPIVGVASLLLGAAWALARGNVWVGVLLLACSVPAVIGLVLVVAQRRGRPR